MHVHQILSLIQYKVTESTKFLWTSLGEDSRLWSFQNVHGEDIGSFVTTPEGEVLELEVMNGNDCYRWIHSDYEDEYKQEGELRGIDMQVMNEEVAFVNLHNEEDCLEKLEAIFYDEEFDERVQINVDFSDENFAAIARIAHENDITFNDQVNLILRDYIQEKLEQNGFLEPVSFEEDSEDESFLDDEQSSVTLTVQEDSSGELFLEFPQDLLNRVGWQCGDNIIWEQKEDGSFFMTKKV